MYDNTPASWLCIISKIFPKESVVFGHLDLNILITPCYFQFPFIGPVIAADNQKSISPVGKSIESIRTRQACKSIDNNHSIINRIAFFIRNLKSYGMGGSISLFKTDGVRNILIAQV